MASYTHSRKRTTTGVNFGITTQTTSLLEQSYGFGKGWVPHRPGRIVAISMRRNGSVVPASSTAIMYPSISGTDHTELTVTITPTAQGQYALATTPIPFVAGDTVTTFAQGTGSWTNAGITGTLYVEYI